MAKKLALVLGGGGARGALQAGALRALIEAGCRPDLVVGTSIGAANAAFLGIHGFTPQGVHRLEQVWRATVDQDLLPTDLWRQFMHAFFQHKINFTQDKIREFAISNGLAPNLCFHDLPGPRLFFIAADLNAGCPVVFGINPEESVLESLEASWALPPWFSPLEKDGRYLVDGGAVSNLPIESALGLGAKEIIALDLYDPAGVGLSATGQVGQLMSRIDKTIEGRQIQLELELAEARGVPVRHIRLTGEQPAAFWDFRRSPELIERGYSQALKEIHSWPKHRRPSWLSLDGLQDLYENVIEVLE